MRRTRTVVVAVALSLLGAGCYQNGRFDPSALTVITPSCSVVHDLAGRLTDMINAAHADGVALLPETKSYLPPGSPEPPRNESCYRSYELQQWWRVYYCSINQCAFAAVPGTSRHGWGRAVDFEDQLGKLTFDSPGYAWLKAHAAAYGFVHPAWAEPGGSSPEPWHWEG
jgi:LAS superfamily LD-carboxypeptidase LdcB